MLRRSFAAAIVLVATGFAARAAEIALACSGLGKEYEICREGAEAWAKSSGHTVRLVSTPNSATERLALFQQLLAAGAADIDVFQIDVVWPGILGRHFVDLAPKAGDAAKAHFPALVANDTVDGKLVAMPWFADAGLLYYRKDLLDAYKRPVPQTWQELAETARLVQDGERKAGRGDVWGLVFQARAYEGLTTNALEWIASHGGGTIVDDKGAITIDNPKAVAALAMAASFIGTISPEGVLNYSEEESRGVFQSGKAVFMRNWPYAWALAQGADSPIKGKIAIAPLPKGGPDGSSAATLGGQELAVSKYSKNADAAADLVVYLTGPQEQKRRAIAGSFNPTIPALFKDAEIVKAAPFIGELAPVFENAVARPAAATGDDYNKVSNAFFNSVHQVLSKRAQPDRALAALDRDLKRLKRGGWSQ